MDIRERRKFNSPKKEVYIKHTQNKPDIDLFYRH